MPIVNSTFKPPWWLRGAHQQSLWSTFFRRFPKTHDQPLTMQRERLELEDGDFFDLSWFGPSDGPIVVVLHGLEGTQDSPYLKGIIQTLSRQNYRCCLFHFRGCSGEPNRLAHSYHSGETGDLHSLIKHIKTHYQRDVFALVGYSLGGNVLLKWWANEGRNSQVKTAVAISVPFSLADTARRMQTGFSRLYQKYLLNSLHKKYRRKFSVLKSPLQIDLKQLNSFYQYDDQITAPLNGFASANDYYQQSSCGQYLQQINKPCLILHAKDDPFMWPSSVPKEEQLSAQVRLELSDCGGHVGFVYGRNPWQPKYWLDDRILSWLEQHKI